MPTVFYSRQWFRYAAAIVWTFLAAFGLVFGPLFLLGILKNANGQRATDAGIALSVLSIPTSLAAALLWFNIAARRQPLLRLCYEAIEIRLIGASALDGIPLVPPLIRIAWLVVSLQGFRSQVGWIPWSMLRDVRVTGWRVAGALVIEGTIIYPSHTHHLQAKIGDSITFADAEFIAPLDEIANAILAYGENSFARQGLPHLFG